MELKIEHLSKQFKDKTAVNDVNLTLTPGVWGLLGANGAGKTTLMRMIADIMTPTNGAVYYDGKDIRELGEVYRSKFGFLPQDFGYHRDFTVKDYLEYVAALKDIPTMATTKKINHLLDILSLSDVKKKKISNLSGGMKRRVGIAQAMLNDPEIVVMDEPTAGLDPGAVSYTHLDVYKRQVQLYTFAWFYRGNVVATIAIIFRDTIIYHFSSLCHAGPTNVVITIAGLFC